jgi:hypothetical protein
MKNKYTAIIKHEGDGWVGWIEEVPGVNCQEKHGDFSSQRAAPHKIAFLHGPPHTLSEPLLVIDLLKVDGQRDNNCIKDLAFWI